MKASGLSSQWLRPQPWTFYNKYNKPEIPVTANCMKILWFAHARVEEEALHPPTVSQGLLGRMIYPVIWTVCAIDPVQCRLTCFYSTKVVWVAKTALQNKKLTKTSLAHTVVISVTQKQTSAWELWRNWCLIASVFISHLFILILLHHRLYRFYFDLYAPYWKCISYI